MCVCVCVCVCAGLWRHLGNKLTDSAKTLIEERLKYADKQLAKNGLAPGYR